MYQDEYELIQALEPEARRRVQAARIALLSINPFYGTLMSSMPLIANWEWVTTMATDGKNLFFNPEFVCGMPEERKIKVMDRLAKHPTMDIFTKGEEKQFIETFYREKTMPELTFTCKHEVRHVTNDHVWRGKTFEAGLHNAACDEYINTTIVMEHSNPSKPMCWFPMGRASVFDPAKEFGFLHFAYCHFEYLGMTSEQIYLKMLNNKPKGRPVGNHMKKDESDEELNILGYNTERPQLTQAEKDEMAEWSRHMIDAALKSAGGEGPEEAIKMIAEWKKPKINYLKMIKQRMVSRVKSNRSFRKISRRSSGLTYAMRKYGGLSNKSSMILPGKNPTDKVDIVVGFDVSGSISKATLRRIFNEIIGICLLYKTFRVTLFCWSTRVGNVCVYTEDNIREMANYEVTSTGGTTAACAFEFIEENVPNAKDVIIFTDGMIEDLRNRKDWARKWDTLWVICGGSRNWKPPFGKAVDMDENVS